MRIKTHELQNGQTLYYTGPDIAWGAVPTIFYFSISGKDSLSLDPYNQPAIFWSKLPLRVCSLDLPHHAPFDDAQEAISKWADDYQNGLDPIEEFLQKTTQSLQHLKNEGLIDNRLAIAGLSRGAFFAAHLAARFPLVQYILGFAPLTKLVYTKEFSSLESLHHQISHFDLLHLTEKLFEKNLRFYIGNRDIRVSTRSCFDFLEALSDKAFQKGVRKPCVEMIMTASIGHQGHGTSPLTFNDGATWLAKHLGIKDEALQN